MIATLVGAGVGSALVAYGCMASIARWITTALSADSGIELFASHCYWGAHYGDGIDGPAWAGGPFQAWKGDLAAQLTAVFNLMCAFRFESKDRTKVRRYLDIESKLPYGKRPKDTPLVQVQHGDCWVHLDMTGEGFLAPEEFERRGDKQQRLLVVR